MESVILAGGKSSPELLAATGCALRGQIPLNGEPMAKHVLNAMPEGKKYIVGMDLDGAVHVEPGVTFLGSLKNALDKVESETFLVAAADMPFLTRGATNQFLERCERSAALNYPIIPADLCAARFPDMKRTTLRTREGRFTGGNMMLANATLLRQIFPTIERAYANRKSPLRLAGQIGIGTLLRLVWGMATPWKPSIASLETAAGRMLGAKVQAVVVETPEIGADIDTLEQYRLAQEYFASGP